MMLRADMSTAQQSEQRKNIPCYFSKLARKISADIQVVDYVRVGWQDRKYELIDIFLQSGSVLVLRIGGKKSFTRPWACMTPLKSEFSRSKNLNQAIRNWLFRGSRVACKVSGNPEFSTLDDGKVKA
ncbi:MAG: hypothetical protein WBG50_09410 [Desulfomonilaceae bacterium]